LFDCCPVSDGAAAVVISKNKCDEGVVEVVGSALSTDSISLSERKDLTSFSAARKASEMAFKQAGIKPKQLSFAEVHDCFTIAELIAMEDIGICAPGNSKKLIRNGDTKIGGRIPINPSGGLKAGGHPIGATGVSQVYEAVIQLRNKAGKNQVKNSKYGLTHNIGGVGGTAVVHILKGNG
jgi:acetyl-CoA C-acetyltransferase